MNKLNNLIRLQTLLALLLIGPAILAQSNQTPSNSANVLPHSATPVDSRSVINACAAAAAELLASRKLILDLEQELQTTNARLAAEKQAVALLRELDATRKSETQALREALSAKNEALAAKDLVITTQEKLLAKTNKKPTLIKQIGGILVGAAAIILLK